MPDTIAVLGAGSWGTALAIHLAKNNNSVVLWGHQPDHIRALQRVRENKAHLPGVPFPKALSLETDIDTVCSSVQDVLVCVPSKAFDTTLEALATRLLPDARVLWACKGLTEQGKLFSEAFAARCPDVACGAISGPSFAREVAMGLPTAVSLASTTPSFLQAFLKRFHSPYFRVYTTTDVIGVELGGVVKNVLAIATGISDGLNFGANAKSALITRGVNELIQLGTTLGASQNTLVGLSGLGDIVLSCTDDQSRNRKMGLALGQGQTVQHAQQSIGQVVEGVKNVPILMQRAQAHGIELPICQRVYQILYHGEPCEEAVKHLLLRAPKSEP